MLFARVMSSLISDAVDAVGSHIIAAQSGQADVQNPRVVDVV